ncbi:MAG: cytochrome P450 [Leucobacter sp.]
MAAPIVDWIDPDQLEADPYPIYRRLREEYPVAYIPFMGSYVVSRFDDCRFVETNPELFASDSGGSALGTMRRTMGRATMLDTDDPQHSLERGPVNPGLRPKAVKEQWTEAFEANTRYYLDRLADAGPEQAELNSIVASPLTTKNLMDFLGIRGVEVEKVRDWSRTIMDGLCNVTDDAEVWHAVDEVRGEVDALLAELIPYLRKNPDNTFTSALVSAGRPDEAIQANVRLALSGGINEPQHAITSSVWSLSEHPEQREDLLANPQLWPDAFEEVLRWVSPLSNIPRRARQDVEIAGFTIPEGSGTAALIAAANRDETVFDRADAFDIRRPKQPNLAFGAGAHQCAGIWVARWSIGSIALPRLYERFAGLRNAEDRDAHWSGFVARGLTEHPVTWDLDRG